MKHVITYRRVTTIVLEHEVERPLSEEEARGWASFGRAGKSALDQIMKNPPPDGVTVETGSWELINAEPPFRVPEKARRRKK